MLKPMGLRMIQGPPNSGRAGELLARLRAVLDRDPVLVVPTGDDVAGFERELARSQATTLGASIATFAGLTREIVRTLAIELQPSLTVPERQALIRAAIGATRLTRLGRSAARPGFAPALDALIAELQAALVTPSELRLLVGELPDPGHEVELADLYESYVALREAAGRSDQGTSSERALERLRADPQGWGGRPVFAYGFDDLSRAQIELLRELSRAGEVTIAASYDDRRALAIRAGLLGTLNEEVGIDEITELPFDPAYTASAALRHLDRNLFEDSPETVAADDGVRLLRCAGQRGEGEAIGIEIARLLASGYEPDEIAVVVRHPERSGPVLAGVMRELGLPVALEASLPLPATCIGASLIALCRAAADEHAVEALLAHLRLDPSLPPGVVDRVERRVRRGEAQTVSGATEGWKVPPRHLTRLREATDAAGRLRALARSARELAEGPHRERAPLVRRAAAGVPFSALELRAGVAAAELLDQLAGIGELPGCEPLDLADAIDALEAASLPQWRGPAAGRIRILSPYRARAARARALFCASLQDGEFPTAIPPDPLLSEERRREIGKADLRRGDQSDEERYLFHGCVSRPTEHLYLSWQSCDEDGAALARSAFVDEVLELLDPAPEITVRGPERSVQTLAEATTEHTLARALARGGWNCDRAAVLERIGVPQTPARATLRLFEGLPDPGALPGPLRVPAVLEELGERRVFSAKSLEGWLECPYKWFVDHELEPLRLEPEADPLWLGGLVHTALEQLYTEAPGDDSIPRPGDVAAWRERFAELLEAVAVDRARAPLNQSRRAALDRARIQVEAFLEAESCQESEFRPDPALLELSFGPFDDEEGGHEPLRLGEIALRGRIDRIDVAGGGVAVVRDYKTGKRVPRADEFSRQGKLQIQIYMRVAERVLGLDPVAGLYQPLGATTPANRKPRGIALAGDERLQGLDLVGRDRRDREQLTEALDDAERTAASAAAEMRLGLIDRRPIGGVCPKYCNFQSICRLERALGPAPEGETNGAPENG
jgi:ATP-dependent helicase/DNAse subunit B